MREAVALGEAPNATGGAPVLPKLAKNFVE
jgi:hypothetical protein